MKEPQNSFISMNLHAPNTAGFCVVSEFCTIGIKGKDGNHNINLLLVDDSGNSLLFLYQLREAVEKAFQYFLNRED